MIVQPLINVTPGELVLKHGADAPRILDFMIKHAIANGCHDEALELDRVRRVVQQHLAA